MTDFEMLSIVIVIIVGFFTVQYQTASLCKDRSDNNNKGTKNSYPSRKDL